MIVIASHKHSQVGNITHTRNGESTNIDLIDSLVA